ncbi:MAG: purine-binding chemotaxis protein CheW [Saccharospirillaceae bacterium]|nr:chemotaxis protein CheW [Pseudomonadales bacterium]NRB80837.1 purine-binding chemotaxis protein CheW [Saccharospirillaceae bacterium]
MSALEKSTDPTDTLDSNDGQIENNDDTQQYLTFLMDGEEYGVDILSVQEIRSWEQATSIPNVPDYVKGVINLRGTIVPIIDLRTRFGIVQEEYSRITVVIVLKIKTSKGERITGIVVDAVSDVYSLATENMRSPPDVSSHVNTDFIKGLINVKEKMVILLDLDKLLDIEKIQTKIEE